MDSFDHIFIAPKNFDASLKFYTTVLSWPVQHSWGGDGEPRGAILRSDGGFTVVLAEPHEDDEDQAWREGRRGHQPTIHLGTEDVRTRFALVARGPHVVIEPEETHW